MAAPAAAPALVEVAPFPLLPVLKLVVLLVDATATVCP